jgi:hypothetical protein
MRKIFCFLAIAVVFLLVSTNAQAEPRVIPRDDMSHEEEVADEALINKLLSIRESMRKTDKPLFYMYVDVVNSTMIVYRLIQESGEGYSLEEMSTHLIGSPKSKKYPKGFGFIYSVEKFPIWAPTSDQVKLFKERGTDFEKFRNAQGKVIIPPSHPLNYMGPVKMKIKFFEKQVIAKLDRDVYRIHGTLKKDEKKLGTRCSGGCIRTRNEEIIELDKQTHGGFIIVNFV